jgi:hypothetical protein
MALVVPNVGEVRLLSNALETTPAATVSLRLYSDDIAPGETDTNASYTECAVAAGYDHIDLAKAGWTVTTVANVASATYAAQTFTFTAAAARNIYGYFVVDDADNTLLWAEEFSDSPHIIPAGGGTQTITLYITAA